MSKTKNSNKHNRRAANYAPEQIRASGYQNSRTKNAKANLFLLDDFLRRKQAAQDCAESRGFQELAHE